jgi:hypothetical protein
MLGPIRFISIDPSSKEEETHLEEIDSRSGVQRWLLVDSSQDRRLLRFRGVQRSSQIKFQTLSDQVFQLDLSSEEVGSGPSLDPISAEM